MYRHTCKISPEMLWNMYTDWAASAHLHTLLIIINCSLQLLFLVDQQPGDWWVYLISICELISAPWSFFLRASLTSCQFIFSIKQMSLLYYSVCVCVCTDSITLLLPGVYALGFLTMAPQLFINHKVCPASNSAIIELCKWLAALSSDASSLCFSTRLHASAEGCEPPAGDSVDVQSESRFCAS